MLIRRLFLHLLEYKDVHFIHTAILNFRLFGLIGLWKMPIFIQPGSRLECQSKNAIVFEKPIKRNMLTLGDGTVIKINKGGRMILSGDNAFFNSKNLVFVSSAGTLEIGNNFWANRNSAFYCRKRLKFGDDVMIAFNSNIMDTDYHPIFNSQKEIINFDKDVIVGNKVWIGCNVTVLKGVQIGNNIVVGAGSVVSRNLLEENAIYFGNPAKFVKGEIDWCMKDPGFALNTSGLISASNN